MIEKDFSENNRYSKTIYDNDGKYVRVVTEWSNSHHSDTIEEVFVPVNHNYTTPTTTMLLSEDKYKFIKKMVDDIRNRSKCSDDAILNALIDGVQIGLMDKLTSEQLMNLSLELEDSLKVELT